MFPIVRFNKDGERVEVILLTGVQGAFRPHREGIEHGRCPVVIALVAQGAQRKGVDQGQVRRGRPTV